MVTKGRRQGNFRRCPCASGASQRKVQRVAAMQIVDRRLNPKSKSLGNRQRFLRRAKAEIREAIKDSLRSRKIAETESAEKVTIRSKSLREPSFGLGRNSGLRDYVLPGNEEYKVGDEIPKPQGGAGGRGRPKSSVWRRSWLPPRRKPRPMPGGSPSCARASSTSSGCAAPSPTSTRSIWPTTVSTACQSRPPRPSCSA